MALQGVMLGLWAAEGSGAFGSQRFKASDCCSSGFTCAGSRLGVEGCCAAGLDGFGSRGSNARQKLSSQIGDVKFKNLGRLRARGGLSCRGSGAEGMSTEGLDIMSGGLGFAENP